MARKPKTKCIGILTSGGDCPGLNAAIRGVAKAAIHHGIKVLGVMDGFRGLVENRFTPLDDAQVSGILTLGGTLLGTSRDKPHKMPMGDQVLDMTEVAVANAKAQQIDCLVCLGGNGTQKNALRIQKAGLNVLTLPKTIDNDVAVTDVSFGFDTAMNIATDAIDRLHTTATSHHRVIVCELMGHKAGWLALGAGIAGGADVVLIPEIPYDLNVVAEHLIERRKHNKRFSIIAVAEGAISKAEASQTDEEKEKKKKAKKKTAARKHKPGEPHLVQESLDSRIARELQQMTGLEARTTSLGHVQRGGSPSARDRLLCTLLGTMAGRLLAEGHYNHMIAVKGTQAVPVPLEKVAGIIKTVPHDHDWLKSAMLVETCLGDHR
ncbi:ATP-dependent 6-phosphofructokinase [Ruficoccus sp. ZRK36]|uniref:6-phosphofructokinase n=1 Tax=Ruficoccus sp. ZRK36 TaxID=2866311 RepID=UPI001C7350BB|nr:ATP-dependent 6-phosphofructokinase [Ruficoccus sp. ZRK36]QYY34426.1 ATP-dependent 6-phosphofructokinase [Ruficoccus sp. ZRK36]